MQFRSIPTPLARAGAILALGVLAPWAAARAPVFDVSASQSSVTADPASGAVADGQDEVTITVVVRNSGGQPVAGQTVLIESSNPLDMIAQPVAPTDEQGRAIATLASESYGAKVLTAVVQSGPGPVELDEQPLIHMAPPVVQPNIIVILLDDVGTDSLSMFDEVNPYQSDLPYVHGQVGDGDVPANGEGTSNLYVNSPNLQQLANEGVTFLNAYAQPMCSPSRATMLTGNYPVRTGVGNIVRTNVAYGAMHEFGDPGFDFPTLPQLSQAKGYDDIIIGKWHLGLPNVEMDPVNGNDANRAWRTIPIDGHFSEWMCVFTNVDTPVDPMPDGSYYNYFFNRNHHTTTEVAADGPETEYATVVQFEEALAWCNSRTNPFLCVVNPNAAHAPWDLYPPEPLVSTGEYVSPPLNAWSGQMAQIEALDAKIGDLVNGLAPAIRQHTTFIVVGDNGIPAICLSHASLVGTSNGITGSGKELGETYEYLMSRPEGRFKASVYEKGARVPMIVAGYGVTNPGRYSDALVDLSDVYPTVAEMLDVQTTSPIHGVSFVPVLEDEVDYHTHARDFTYSEMFTPIGVTGPTVAFDDRLIGCSLRIPGQGRYKITYDQDLPGDRFYKLQDASGNFVDPFETNELPHGPGDPEYGNYLLVLAKLQEIVASGDGTGPQECTAFEQFCSSEPNSTGAPAVIGIDGSCSVAVNNLSLETQPVPNQFGIYYYSDGQVNGGNGIPYGNGLRCVGGTGSSIFRLPITMAEDNVLRYQVVFPELSSTGQILPGTTWNFQAWFRDPAGGGAQFDFSDAIEIQFGP